MRISGRREMGRRPRPDPDPDQRRFCCEEFQSAYDVTFASPADRTGAWLLYGTDWQTVSTGEPELRYWPIRHCPFCGALLLPASESMIKRPAASPSPQREEGPP